jgi:hypothetical protein
MRREIKETPVSGIAVCLAGKAVPDEAMLYCKDWINLR